MQASNTMHFHLLLLYYVLNKVIIVCEAANPRLIIRRACFSALIDREIHEAAQNLGQSNKFFADVVDARQFPTLGFIAGRYWEVQLYKSEEFCTINCSHRSDEGIATFNWIHNIWDVCRGSNCNYVRKQEKLKYPPHALNTIELEKRASRYFRTSSEYTMKVNNWFPT